MNIAVIPARGGSKRIPRKNIRYFAGKPMIAYAIEVAKASSLFDRIIVSTDDDEISRVAQGFGAECPFLRDPEISDDYAPTVSVIVDAIKKCEALSWRIDKVCCIYPCVPFLTVAYLSESLKLLEKSNMDFSFPIARFPSVIQRALKKNQDSSVSPFFLGEELVRTQDLEPAFYDAGQFYWGSRDAWVNNSKIHSNGVCLEIPECVAIDIDTEEDWIFAERMQKVLNT